ncbi:hypothetical protein COO58_04045 [Micromonospora sp. WMMA1996]|nr:hypothetical protein [Micromonospora sp. WMMA1996]PGH43704.1 hypothetical protein COO58_04045 [Micromonospora sp. WMMA1996]
MRIEGSSITVAPAAAPAACAPVASEARSTNGSARYARTTAVTVGGHATSATTPMTEPAGGGTDRPAR